MSMMQPSLGVGFALPQVFPDGNVDLETIRRIAGKAETLGYESLWTMEQIIGPAVTLEPLSLLAYLATVTKHVRLGVSVMVLPLRNPVQLAKELSTLDVLSQGRLTVGVGLGSEANNAAFGVAGGRRVGRFLEGLRVMKALWTEDSADVKGDFFQLDGAMMRPKPVQKPHPPVWFGARTEAAIRRAVIHGDGWMGPGSSSAGDFAQHVGLIRRSLDETGRDPATFPISKRVYLAIDDSPNRAEERLRPWFAHTYGSADMANRVAIWGSQSHCLEQIQSLIEAGAQHLMLNPVFDYDEHLEALQVFVPDG